MGIDKEFKGHILVAESDIPSAELLECLCDLHGFKVTTVRDLNAFNQVFQKENDIDLVLLEPLTLTVGFEPIHPLLEFHQTLSHIPIIFISTMCLMEFNYLFGKPRGSGYMVKPIDAEKLFELVDTILKKIISSQARCYFKSAYQVANK